MAGTQQKPDCTRKDYLYYWSEMKLRYYTVGDLSISSRVLKHWKEKGVFQENPTLSWSRFTFVELLWLLMVQQLRQFGFPLGKLKTVRRYLFGTVDPGEFGNNPSAEQEPIRFYEVRSRISHSLYRVLDRKIQVGLRVFADGGCELIDEIGHEKTTAPHIMLSLYDFIKRFNLGCIHSGLRTNPAFISPEEITLFRIINSMHITGVDIDYIAEKPSESFDTGSGGRGLLIERLHDAMLLHGYGRICVRHDEGSHEILCNNQDQSGSLKIG